MKFSREWIDESLAAISDKKERVMKMIYFVTNGIDFMSADCVALTTNAEKLSREIGFSEGVMAAQFYASYLKIFIGKPEEAFRELAEHEPKILALSNSTMRSLIVQMYAFFYWSTGQRDKAFEYAYEILKTTRPDDVIGFGWTYFMLGVFHFDLKDYDTSLDYFLKTEARAINLGEDYPLARSRAGISGIHIARGKYDEAMVYAEQALDGFRRCGHKTAISRSLNDLGVIYERIGRRNEAKEFLREALDIRRALDYTPGVITTQMELAQLKMADEDLEDVESLLLSSLTLSEKTKSKQKIAQAHKLLAEFYKRKNDPWKALKHHEEFFESKMGIEGEEASNKISRLQQKFATEKSEQEAEIHRLKNVELKKAYDEIEEKNKSILDSINYAKRIQNALLASDTLLGRYLQEYFVLFKPKDIVSGDFYWAAERDNLFFFAAADSTGHGVPGAFMSLLNSSFLDEAVADKELTEPAAILNEVRLQLVRSLNQEGSEEETRDGMDCTLMAFDTVSLTLRFACANNPLLLVRAGEMKIFGPDKFPVGIHPGYLEKPFTPHEIQLQKGDMVYLLTDGYADQFGGPQGKKFKFRQLRETLLGIHGKPADEQKKRLEKFHADWKGELEQVDDILIAGFRVI